MGEGTWCRLHSKGSETSDLLRTIVRSGQKEMDERRPLRGKKGSEKRIRKRGRW